MGFSWAIQTLNYPPDADIDTDLMVRTVHVPYSMHAWMQVFLSLFQPEEQCRHNPPVSRYENACARMLVKIDSL